MRYVMLDRITELVPGEVARAQVRVAVGRRVRRSLPRATRCCRARWSSRPWPSSAGCCSRRRCAAAAGNDLHALLTMIDRTKFRRVVRPGDRLELEARVETATEDGGRIKGWARLDGALAAEAELGFAFAVVTDPILIARRREHLNVWLHGSVTEPT
ncbi:MAG: hypothetical protein IPL61_15885 [Myxococcales bacterium]|nr:hypothetical protein [Myxococcales bacterium]